MGTRGPAPRPKAINDLLGDPSNRRGEKVKEPTAKKGWPKCNKSIQNDPVAYEEWQQLCEDLDGMGLLSSIDRIALELLVKAYSRYRENEDKVIQYGEIIVSKKTNYPSPSPYALARDRAAEQLKKLLIEFGLTPAARARLRYEEKEPDSGLAQFILKSA